MSPRLKNDEVMEIPSWTQGIEKSTAIALNEPGTLADGQNFVPTQASRLITRGGSRIMVTLKNDAGSPVEVTGLCGVFPWTSIGALVVGYDTAQHKSYAWYMTQDMAFKTGTESTSRVDLSAAPAGVVITAGEWKDVGGAPMPQFAELFEGIFLADAQTTQSQRRYFISLNQTTPVVQGANGAANMKVPRFAFAGGAAQEITPYCLEIYNNVLFVAGYGDESANNADRPEYLRHSFLGRSPSNSISLGDATDGFDKDAWNILGAKGQRITAMKQGRGLLLVAKANELYRVSGAGRAYPGWQYAVEMVMNTSGFGISNPNALCFAEGFWYGIGAAGMFRTDGFSVNTMVGPRKPDFLALDNLSNAFCFYHPDRRVIVFGVHPQGTTPATFPWMLWTWDVERQRWQPDWVFSTATAFFHGNAVATTTVSGPSGSPSAPNTTGTTTSGYTANWTNGDASALTEFWELDTTMTWNLIATVNPGVATYARTGDLDHTQYTWKVRHKKNGLFSPYSGTATANTLIVIPSLSAVLIFGNVYQITVTITNSGTGDVVTIQRSARGMGIFADYQVWTNQTTGTQTLNVSGGFDWQVHQVDGSWPVPDSGFSAVLPVG